MIYAWWLKTYDELEYEQDDDPKPHRNVKGAGELDGLSSAIGRLALDLPGDEVLEIVVQVMEGGE